MLANDEYITKFVNALVLKSYLEDKISDIILFERAFWFPNCYFRKLVAVVLKIV